jgi:pyruvate dehydrogenase E2 component (dihydrolipoamide acetyltransferase)
MVYEIMMPQLSDSMEEGKLISWKVKVGDHVSVGDLIAEVESDKAIMEVQSFREGIVKELRLKEGDMAPVGTTMALLETSSKESIPIEKESVKQPKVSPSESIPTPKSPSIHIEGSASPKAKAIAAKYGLDIAKLQKQGKLPTPANEEAIEQAYMRRYFTPKALQLIARYHLSIDAFERGKKYGEKEVRAYIEKHDIPLPKPLDAMHKAMIAIVTESAKKPVFHIYDAIDATMLKQYQSTQATMTVWLIKLIGEAMMHHEAFRTTLKEHELQVWSHASISVAMAYNEALYMPVFKDVNKKSLQEIAQRLRALKERVTSQRVLPDDLEGATFGISNLGMMGVARFDALIYKDASGIAAIGSEREGKIPITLTLDHRIINGYQAAEFMERLKELAVDDRFYKRGVEDV